jgi:hypothetical protein
LRIVDDDSDVVVVDDEGGSGGAGGRLTLVGFVVDKTTGGACLFKDSCEELTKGFADAATDGFLRRWPPPRLLSYR